MEAKVLITYKQFRYLDDLNKYMTTDDWKELCKYNPMVIRFVDEDKGDIFKIVVNAEALNKISEEEKNQSKVDMMQFEIDYVDEIGNPHNLKFNYRKSELEMHDTDVGIYIDLL